MSKNPLALLEKDTWFAHISGIRTYIRVIYCKSAQFIQFTVNPGWFAMLFAYFQLPRGPWAVSALFNGWLSYAKILKRVPEAFFEFSGVVCTTMNFFFQFTGLTSLKC